MESEWMSVKEMVKNYRVSKSLVYKLIKEGKIPFQKFGEKKIIINKSKLDMLLNDKEK